MTTPPEKFVALNNALVALRELRVGDAIPPEVGPLLDAMRGPDCCPLPDWKALRDVADDNCHRSSVTVGTSSGRTRVNVVISHNKDQSNRRIKRIIMRIDRLAAEFGVAELSKAQLLEILEAWYPKAAASIPTVPSGRKLWWDDMGMKDKPQGRGNITPQFRARLQAGR